MSGHMIKVAWAIFLKNVGIDRRWQWQIIYPFVMVKDKVSYSGSMLIKYEITAHCLGVTYLLRNLASVIIQFFLTDFDVSLRRSLKLSLWHTHAS